LNSDKEDYIKTEILNLDNKIAAGERIIAATSHGDEAETEKLHRILKAKVADWKNKRDFLVELTIKNLKK
jgi:hypothetical protein